MNVEHAQFFANRYNEMIETITAKLPRNERENLRGIEIHSNGGVQVNYETYIGCGDYEPDQTYYSLSDFFEEI